MGNNHHQTPREPSDSSQSHSLPEACSRISVLLHTPTRARRGSHTHWPYRSRVGVAAAGSSDGLHCTASVITNHHDQRWTDRSLQYHQLSPQGKKKTIWPRKENRRRSATAVPPGRVSVSSRTRRCRGPAAATAARRASGTPAARCGCSATGTCCSTTAATTAPPRR